MVGSKIKSHFDLNYHNLKDKSLQLATDASEPAKEVERDLGCRKPPLPLQWLECTDGVRVNFYHFPCPEMRSGWSPTVSSGRNANDGCVGANEVISGLNPRWTLMGAERGQLFGWTARLPTSKGSCCKVNICATTFKKTTGDKRDGLRLVANPEGAWFW